MAILAGWAWELISNEAIVSICAHGTSQDWNLIPLSIDIGLVVTVVCTLVTIGNWARLTRVLDVGILVLWDETILEGLTWASRCESLLAMELKSGSKCAILVLTQQLEVITPVSRGARN